MVFKKVSSFPAFVTHCVQCARLLCSDTAGDAWCIPGECYNYWCFTCKRTEEEKDNEEICSR